MNRPIEFKTRPQLALESYLDALLQDATAEELPEPILVLEPSSTLDEFQLAVLEEQARDANVVPIVAPVVVPIVPVVEAPVVVEPVVEVHLPPSITPPPVTGDDRPAWAAEPFECLLFDVAGLTLAVPLVCLGSIYSLEGQELTPLFGQPEWFLGILPSQAGNLKVLDTARWVMPDRYRDDFRQGLQYVISVQGYEWGLAVHQVSRSLRLDPNEIKWRSQRGQRPWLAGTVIEHMCALLDVAELAELIASGAVKTMPVTKRS
ncbi:chemotaxis protein CheW [Pseudomonas kairouanensis]|uniref:Chemotaxis protein CheW n=1 Tax=Pseudomonas kairouanensis TaxID=2293832 RepID=A0A4Z0AEV9_9PSED|nr:CheW domain-containing protein [Pseudomonas kairouanensis]TFY84843.1 chemotaxis protein CheW [Pseudomonas kairouanensis]